jgi:mannosylglycoprotein endo-beta-mannosidase
MLRFSHERYDAEVRYHRDMNLNMIRVWGGGITERPEFYDACDKYGMLVMQDLWMTGDCNGRWYDTYKKDDTIGRRAYPDDHQLWLTSCADQVKMLRNHASLAWWCGGNEIRPPADILANLRDTLLPALDGDRYFFEYSNHDSMSLHAHDGPYTIQKDNYFWSHRSYAFNSEIGSVGIGDMESLQRFIPRKNLVPPYYDQGSGKWVADSVWQYHKYCSYDSAIEAYGHPQSMADFAQKAQLVNYTQYRALMEGFSARMWDWYTGVMVWKTQNPWTAMVGQMYDVYLDPNACMFGLQEGAKPLHVMYDPIWKSVMVVNNDPVLAKRVKLRYSITKAASTIIGVNDSVYVIPPDTCIIIAGAPDMLKQVDMTDTFSGGFLHLKLTDESREVLDENLYWFPGSDGTYKWMSKIRPAYLSVTALKKGKGAIVVSLKNRSESNISFFNRVSVVDRQSKKRILPVFCNNNYISVPPQGERLVTIELNGQNSVPLQVCVEGWNSEKIFVDIKK